MRDPRSTHDYFDPAGLRLLALLFQWRRFLVLNVLVIMVVAAAASLLMTNVYRSQASILPPKEESPMLPRGAVDLLVGLGPVGFAGVGLPASSSQQFAAVLRSRSLADIVITREDLVTHYELDTLPEARRQFTDNLAVTIDADGLVNIKVADRDPQKAASVAQTALSVLDSINQSLSTGSAAATRRFVESRVGEVEQELRRAENELRVFQEEYGTIAIEEQLAVLLANLAQLRVERMQQEMDLAILTEGLAPDNKRLQAARQKLRTLDLQIDAVESTGDSTASLTAGNAPRLAMQSVRLLRQVTVYEQLYQFLRQALEQAKIDERRDIPTFTILDPPIPPDRKWKPRRTFVVLGSGAVGLVLLTLLVVWTESTRPARDVPPVDYRSGWRRLLRRERDPVNEGVA